MEEEKAKMQQPLPIIDDGHQKNDSIITKDSPVKKCDNSQQQNPDDQPKRFIHCTEAELLGIRFLRNERKTFEQDVERSMHQFIQERILRENNNNDSAELPAITVNIPDTIKDFVEFHIQTKSKDHSDAIFGSVKQTNREFFEDFKNEEHIRNMLANPIRVLVGKLFLYRGPLDTPVERCLTLTTPFVASQNRYQQCLVLCFESPAKVTEVLNVFRKLPGIFNQHSAISSNNVVLPAITTNQQQQQCLNECKVMMNAEVEIQEEIQDGKWQTCPYDKDTFKLKAMLDKKIIITLCQDLAHYTYPVIRIERCFGILLSAGRNVSPNQMVAIGLNSMSTSFPYPELHPNLQQWQIIANWIPAELDFPHLNTETPRTNRVFFTIALDLILEQVDEPIRFVFEAKAKILPPSVSTTEKLWKNLTTNLNSRSSRALQENFSLIVRQRCDDSRHFEIVSCLSSTQIAMQKRRLTLMLGPSSVPESNTSASSPTSPVPEEDSLEDDDEPLQSGSGSVNKECSQNELQAWQTIMERWNRDNLTVRPRRLSSLVHRDGVPQALRPEVWQLLSGAHEIEEKILPKYKLLVTQKSPYESLIGRDISRTFTAHEKFRDAGAEQDALFRVCKAYSNYDAEIGYCQGMSYLVAALLLNMPEEQAFCVLVQIMYRYGLRDLFKSGLEQLHCKFYQLERLIDEHIPELYCHFADLRVDTHMYASQWFLTLFTTKFPLNMIAICLLQMSKNDLLALDFEGVLKYFRVTLPKLYRTDEAARELIRRAVKINVKKAKKYEQQFREWREKNRDPLESLQTENKRLMQAVARLEQENDDLSQELLSVCHAKIQLKQEVNRAEDKAETLNSVLLQTKTHLVDSEENRRQLTDEMKNLKDMCRKQIEQFESEKQNDRKIIEEYKKICRNYQEKYELCQNEWKEKLEKICGTVRSCLQCSDSVQKIISPEVEQDDHDAKTSSLSGDDLQPKEDPVKQELYKKICDLESELIKTKIALAESEDRNGQLVGKLYSTSSELNLLKAANDERAAAQSNTWFSKTLSSLRDAANKQSPSIKPSMSVSQGISNSNTTGTENINGHENHGNKSGFRRNSSQSDH